MATDWTAIRQKKDELMETIPQEIKDKYLDKSGVYAIYIEDELVYIGESSNILNRWVAHKINTLFNFKQKDYQEDKYAVLRDAMKAGLRVSCNVLEYCENDKTVLRAREAAYINAYNPILNGGHSANINMKGFFLINELLDKINKKAS